MFQNDFSGFQPFYEIQKRLEKQFCSFFKIQNAQPKIKTPLKTIVFKNAALHYWYTETHWIPTQQTVDIDIVRKNRIRRGRGTQEGTQNMRYNVRVHQSSFIPALPSAGTFYEPLFNHCGRGQLPLCNVKWLTSFRSPKGLQSERLKIEGLSVYGTFYSLNPISCIPSKSP